MDNRSGRRVWPHQGDGQRGGENGYENLWAFRIGYHSLERALMAWNGIPQRMRLMIAAWAIPLFVALSLGTTVGSETGYEETKRYVGHFGSYPTCIGEEVSGYCFAGAWFYETPPGLYEIVIDDLAQEVATGWWQPCYNWPEGGSGCLEPFLGICGQSVTDLWGAHYILVGIIEPHLADWPWAPMCDEHVAPTTGTITLRQIG